MSAVRAQLHGVDCGLFPWVYAGWLACACVCACGLRFRAVFGGEPITLASNMGGAKGNRGVLRADCVVAHGAHMPKCAGCGKKKNTAPRDSSTRQLFWAGGTPCHV
jgi:hypothetical protein